jgi:hypothetical protein
LLNGLLLLKKKFQEECLGGINVNENWRMQYNKELTQLYGDLDVLSFVRISLLKWTGRFNTIDSKRKVSRIFNSNRQGSGLRGRP